MNKIIDFLFSDIVTSVIYAHRMKSDKNNNRRRISSIADIYVTLFIFMEMYIGMSITMCVVILQDLNIIDSNGCIYTIIIMFLVPGILIYQANKEHYIKNKIATIEPKSNEEIKKYCNRFGLTKLLPALAFLFILMFTTFLLHTYVFHN